MILINLLPHREAARKQRKDMFSISLALSALVGGVLAGMVFLWFQAQVSTQQGRNQILQTDIKKFDEQIKDIAGLESEIAALRARQQAVEDLQADRNMPVHLLTDLVNQLPEGVYISNMSQAGQSVNLLGVAQSNERVSELLRNLSTKSVWLTRPELIEIVSGSVALTARDQRRVSNFKIRVNLVRTTDASKAKTSVAAASAVAKPAAVATSSASK